MQRSCGGRTLAAHVAIGLRPGVVLQELDALHVSLQRLMDHVVQGLVLQEDHPGSETPPDQTVSVCVCVCVHVCVCVFFCVSCVFVSMCVSGVCECV